MSSVTPDHDATHTRKRPRPVVSCLRCREKKLRCDRTMPCENCTKTGYPSECTYNQSASSVEGQGLPKAKRMQVSEDRQEARGDAGNAGAGVGIIEELQLRLAKLEEAVGRPHNVDVVMRESSNCIRPGSPPFLGTLVVKGNRTRYHGQNNRITLLNQFEEAKDFINQCTKDPTMIGLAKEVQFLQSKAKMLPESPDSFSDLESSPELQQLRVQLPPKGVCDQLVELYTLNFEKTLRILHVPSFLRQYEEFWADPDNEIYRSSSFIPQLTAVLTVALPLEDRSFETEHALSWEYLQMPAVNFARLWLRKLGRKKRTELATLQVEALLLLARRLRLVTPEEQWRETGTLVRSAMVMGLHLNLTEYADLSAFQMELRRRLWITIVEIDLQASIESGMPVTIPDVEFGVPANLNDGDFHESSELPQSKGLHEWTESLALVTLAMSLPHRIRAMMLVRTAVDQTEIAMHGRRLEECLRQIPYPLKLDQASKTSENPTMLLNRVMLDVYTRRPLLCLYRPIVMDETRRDNQTFFEIQQSCLESSLVILSYQDHFDPSVADLDVFNSTSYWDTFQNFCKNDILWAALSICGYMQFTTLTPSQVQSGSSTPRAATHTKASLTRIVETTLDSLTRQIGETGSSLKDVLLLAVVLQSVRARGSGQMKDHLMQQGATKALSTCRQNLLLSAAGDQTFPFNLSDFANMFQSAPMFTPTPQPQPQPRSRSRSRSRSQVQTQSLPQLPDFLESSLASEFNDFQGDPFTFEDGSFAWNI